MIAKDKYNQNALLVEPNFGERYEDVTVQCSLCHEQPIHMHNCLEIIYVFRGSVEIKISYETNRLEAGEFMAINLLEVHSVRAIDDDALIANIHISNNLFPLENGFILWWDEALKRNKAVYDKQAGSIKDLILRYTNRAAEQVLLINIKDIIKTFLNEFKIEAFWRCVENGSLREEELERIHGFYMYMYEHLDEKLTLEKMASHFAISSSYLSHYIKSAMGMNFHTALNIMRCDRAETALLGSKLTIGEICESYGFSSNKYFNTVFKKCFGMLPSEYRKKYQGETIARKKAQEVLVDNIFEYINENVDSTKHQAVFDLGKENAEITVIETIDGKEMMNHFSVGITENLQIDFQGEELIVIIKKQKSH